MKSKLAVFLTILVCVLSFSVFARAVVYAADLANPTVTVQNIQGPSVADELKNHVKSSWPWYVARASGLVAAAALTLLLLSGIGQITGRTYRILAPLTAWATHRSLGITFGISVVVHVISLLFDKFVHFNILQVFVPWLSHYRPVHYHGMSFGSLWVALGVLALYAVALVIISTFLWMEKKPYIWKWIHLLSYVIFLLVFVHALYLGTDLSHGIIRVIWYGIGAIVFIAMLARLWRAKTI